MITENLSTLKIHKLTQEQYDREYAAGSVDSNAMYLTPDNNVVDYIVEQGTSGIWTYRKWNNGLAECWCDSVFEADSCTENYGGLYITPSADVILLPISFINTPMIFGAATGASKCFCLVTSTKTQAQVYVVSNTSGETNIPYCLNVVGRWK